MTEKERGFLAKDETWSEGCGNKIGTSPDRRKKVLIKKVGKEAIF